VRIENLVLNVRPTEASSASSAVRDADAVPIDTRLIERTLMATTRSAGSTHITTKVRRRVSPLVSGGAAQWLQERTAQFDSARLRDPAGRTCTRNERFSTDRSKVDVMLKTYPYVNPALCALILATVLTKLKVNAAQAPKANGNIP